MARIVQIFMAGFSQSATIYGGHANVKEMQMYVFYKAIRTFVNKMFL